MNTFFVEGLKHLYEVGTFVPSSPWLARSMARSVSRDLPPQRVLEVGAGTGAITRQILALLKDGDEFHLVEVNPRFCRHLEKRLLRRYRHAHPGVRVVLHCDSITSTKSLDGQFDTVICSVPFQAFTPDLVVQILDRLVALTVDQGEVTFTQYAGVRYLEGPFVSRARSREIHRIGAICRAVESSHGGSRELVLLNLLPSFVVRFTVNGQRPAP